MGLLFVSIVVDLILKKSHASRKFENRWKANEKILMDEVNYHKKKYGKNEGQVNMPPVPFYIHEEEILDWYGILQRSGYGKALDKHESKFDGDDIVAIRQAKVHPWRVHNPEDAEIFLIPIIAGFLVEDLTYERFKWKVDATETMPEFKGNRRLFADVIEESAEWLLDNYWFKRKNGSDHLIIANHWNLAPTESLNLGDLFSILKSGLRPFLTKISYKF